MPVLKHEEILFNYEIEGDGIPLVMLHGLGGNLEQPRSLVGELHGYRRIYIDCRAHGKTTPVGPEGSLSFDRFADDVIYLLDVLAVRHPVLSGISMGAGVSANIAVRYPGFARALVLVRPAWLDRPNPQNLAVFPIIARLLHEFGTEGGKQKFISSDEYRRVKETSAAVAESVLGQFDAPFAVERSARLERMPGSCPIAGMADCHTIECPALVVVTDTDSVHPMEYGRIWADAIPDAKLVQVTAKSVSDTEHTRKFRKALKDFLALVADGELGQS